VLQVDPEVFVTMGWFEKPLHESLPAPQREKRLFTGIQRIPRPFPPLKKGRWKKIDLVLFRVIPAKAGIQCFQSLSNFLDPGLHRGDGQNSIFSQLQGDKGGFNGFSKG
jgi:hypothetical protein